jgi:hypothetical protein
MTSLKFVSQRPRNMHTISATGVYHFRAKHRTPSRMKNGILARKAGQGRFLRGGARLKIAALYVSDGGMWGEPRYNNVFANRLWVCAQVCSG